LQKITVVLTAAQIEAMNGTPVNIIPGAACGPGRCARTIRDSDETGRNEISLAAVP
jgi:hypothetical protein